MLSYFASAYTFTKEERNYNSKTANFEVSHYLRRIGVLGYAYSRDRQMYEWTMILSMELDCALSDEPLAAAATCPVYGINDVATKDFGVRPLVDVKMCP